MGGGGTHWEYSADASTGNHRAYCYGAAWATAMVTSRTTYSGATLTKITIHVSIKNGYVFKSTPWFSWANAKLRVKFVDLTTGSVLYDNYSTWDYMNGDFSKYYSFTATVQSGHTYEVAAGAYVETGYGWFGNYGTAEAKGTVDLIEVVGDP